MENSDKIQQIKDGLRGVGLPLTTWGQDDCNITLTKRGNQVRVCFERMYEYVEMNFKGLTWLSEYFGSVQIDVENDCSSGCDTCDWGSSYELTVVITEATRNVPA